MKKIYLLLLSSLLYAGTLRAQVTDSMRYQLDRVFAPLDKSQIPTRLLDAYVSVSGPNTYKLAELAKNQPFDIPASRFLRPWSGRLAPLEGLRLRRILSGMTHAARHGEVFHLWWHPHNFGANLPQNMAVLRQIAEHFRALQRQYGFRTQTMAEMADELAQLAAR